MICDICDNCNEISLRGGKFKISCLAKGNIEIADSWEDNFRCESFVEEEEEVVEKPSKPNVLVILKCGRDIALIDESIGCFEDFEIEKTLKEKYVVFDNYVFATDDISVLAYIGDENV